MSVVDDSYGYPMKLEEDATAPLAGGIMQYGYQCGMLWGATLAAGAQAYRLLGPGPQAEAGAMTAAQRLVTSFKKLTKDEINCLEITDMNMRGDNQVMPLLKFIFTGGPIGCFRMAANYAPVAVEAINSALSDSQTETPAPPVSCTAILAQKMGESDQKSVMAAGLAGGIGFSGGACGALGAAIWIIGMNGRKEGVDNKVINSRIEDAIDTFINCSEGEFECSEIVGRKFESIGDHASYLQGGGCSAIIEALATA